MKNKKENALGAFMSAAMALPIVAIPLQAGADEIIPPILPVGATMGGRMLYYKESKNLIKVLEPVGWIKSPIGENWEISLSGTLDIVGGASPITVSNQSGRPTQITTGASITDHRKAGDLALKYKWDNASFGASRSESSEKDYESKAVGLNATFDFNERNTTLALGHGLSNDRVQSTTDARLNERRDSREYMVGLTQLIDRDSLVQSNLVHTKGSGFLSDPYKLTVSFFTTGLPILLAKDARPDTRSQWAWLTRYKKNLPGSGASLTAEYRYYKDDWGIRAHTLYGGVLSSLNDRWKWEAGLRYYSQNQADFYRAEITSRPAPRYTSSDQRLASFGALEPSIKFIYQLTDGTAVDAGISLYRQQGNWKFGGSGTSTFEALQAVMFTAGFVHRF